MCNFILSGAVIIKFLILIIHVWLYIFNLLFHSLIEYKHSFNLIYYQYSEKGAGRDLKLKNKINVNQWHKEIEKKIFVLGYIEKYFPTNFKWVFI